MYTLQKIAMVSMGSKNVGDENTKAHLGRIVISAIKQVMEKDAAGKTVIDHDFIKVEKKAGGAIGDTQLINGVLVDKEISHPGMPRNVANAKIALLDVALEIEKTETEAKIEITSPEQMQAFLQQEERMLKDMVTKIQKSGATAVFTQKGIDDVAQHYLAKAGIMAIRRIKKSDIEKLGKGDRCKDSNEPGRPECEGPRLRRPSGGEEGERGAHGLCGEVQGPEERDDIRQGRQSAGHR